MLVYIILFPHFCGLSATLPNTRGLLLVNSTRVDTIAVFIALLRVSTLAVVFHTLRLDTWNVMEPDNRTLDLSYLTEEEREHLLAVIRADDRLRTGRMG